MEGVGKFGIHRLIDQPVAFDTGFTLEDIRHDPHAEMALAAAVMPGVARMLGGVVENFEQDR